MWTGAKTPPYYPKAQLDKCYDDTFDPKRYSYKTNEDLAGWMRNLSLMLSNLLQEKDFNADLFEKLQSRYEGIKSELERRRAEAGKPNLESARKRGREWLESQELKGDTIDGSAPVAERYSALPGRETSIRAVLPTPPKSPPVPATALIEEVRTERERLKKLKEEYTGPRFNEKGKERD